MRGESVSNAYWRGTGIEPAAATNENWLRTGDIGEQDAEGHLFFKGRSKNVVVTPAGMKVFPEDLEAALRRQTEIRDCIVLPVTPTNGCNAEAFAVLLMREPGTDAAPVVTRANESLAEYQHILRWMIWPDADFPRTATGKPRINEIAQRVAAPELQPKSSQGLQELIAKFSNKSEHGATSDFSQSARLEADLGLSSLDRVELIGALEDRYQIAINEAGAFSGHDRRRAFTNFAACRTVRFARFVSDLAAALASHMDSRDSVYVGLLADHTSARASTHPRPREIARKARPALGSVQSHHR